MTDHPEQEPPPSIGILGVVLRTLTPHRDARGSLTETYRREWVPGAREMVQANLSRSRAGVLRGLHVHREQSDYWVVLSGRAFVGLVDLRDGSPSQGRSTEVRIDAEREPSGLFIPPGVAHGFYAETEVLLQYLVDRPYVGDDEFGLAWDDPHVAIAWPERHPELSERDQANPSLADLRSNGPRFAYPG